MDSAELSRLLGVWTDADERLPDALARTISELVDHGFVPAGSTLPPQRELAQVLGVARGTVASALAMLEAGGYVVSTRGSGTRVRSGRVSAEHRAGGRLFSFTNAPRDVIDLSSGALPASAVTGEVLSAGLDGLDPYLETDGYFPAGLPVLRQAIAEHLTRDGVPTRPAEVLVTSGAQQATSLAIRGLLDPGDLVLTEDPSYRGALCALRDHGVRLEGVPLRDGGIDVSLVARAAVRRPAALYCQTSIHNPTGQSMTRHARAALADVVNRRGLPVIEDCCSYDLTLSGYPASTLTGLVAPELHLSCWTMSKLFWGGLRVGWVKADEARIRRLVELRKVDDLATSIVDQLYAVRLLRRAAAGDAHHTPGVHGAGAPRDGPGVDLAADRRRFRPVGGHRDGRRRIRRAGQAGRGQARRRTEFLTPRRPPHDAAAAPVARRSRTETRIGRRPRRIRATGGNAATAGRSPGVSESDWAIRAGLRG